MFGFGWMEIGLLVLVLILVFGPGRAGGLLGRAFGTVRKVDRAKRQFRDAVNPLNLLDPSGPEKPAAEKKRPPPGPKS